MNTGKMLKINLGYKKNSQSKRGSALILTMFIMAGMLIVSLGGAYVVFLGIKAGTIDPGLLCGRNRDGAVALGVALEQRFI